MPIRVNAYEPSDQQLEHARFAELDAKEGFVPGGNIEIGYRLARERAIQRDGMLSEVTERRLQRALARAVARDEAARDIGNWHAPKAPPRSNLEPLDYGRLMTVDVALQETAERVYGLDLLDRQEELSFTSKEVQASPWYQVGVTPSELNYVSEETMGAIASGCFEDLAAPQRHSVELMLLRGLTRPTEDLDRELMAAQERLDFAAQSTIGFSTADGMSVTREEYRGLVDRLVAARNLDNQRDSNLAGRQMFSDLADGSNGRPSLGLRTAKAVLDGEVRSPHEQAARVAAQYMVEQGLPFDRAMEDRLTKAVNRVDFGKWSSPEMSKHLLVDVCAQVMAGHKTSGLSESVSLEQAKVAERISTDILGEGSVPTFTHLDREQRETRKVAKGDFRALTDDHGLAASLHLALHRSGRDADMGLEKRLAELVAMNGPGHVPDKGWHRAGQEEGVKRLQTLSKGPANLDLPLQRAVGLER